MLDNFPLWPVGASSHSFAVDALYLFLVVVSVATTLAIFAAVGIFAFKYRRRHGREAEPIHGSLILEIAWSAAPMGLFLIFFAWGAVIFFDARTPPQDSTEIYVVAKQWMWKLEHTEGQRELNELHVPVGKNIKLIMTSQDVIHSFYVPAFRLKQDVIPGRYTTMWFKATKPGTYHLFCAQYCGTEHSGMIGDVVVMEPAEYQTWLAGGVPTGTLAQNGQALFSQLGCSTCHRFDVQGRGPNLTGVYGKPVLLEDGRTVIADENYVRESILIPTAKVVSGFKPVMPSFQGQVSEEQLTSLVAYVKSLSLSSSQAPAAAAANAASSK
jgi:cytochrome c oxidase subunit 2